jgi:rhodanese-related sulfurtransferase
MEFQAGPSKNVFTRGLKKGPRHSRLILLKETRAIFHLMSGKTKNCVQALMVLMFSTGLAFSVNALRSQGLPLVMPFPPEQQCSSRAQSGHPVKVAQALNSKMTGREDVVFVDARSRDLFELGHIKGAINVPYSFVEPIPKETIRQLSRFRTVIVYCNTRDSENSSLLAGELSEQGVAGAAYLEGGFLEWVREGGKYTGQRPEHYE